MPGQNTDGNGEVFVFDTTLGTFIQITDSAVGNSGVGGISRDGARLSVVSSANLAPGMTRGLFIADEPTGTLTEVVSTTSGFIAKARISGDGRRVVFRSGADLVPLGNLEGISEIFLATCDFPPATDDGDSDSDEDSDSD